MAKTRPKPSRNRREGCLDMYWERRYLNEKQIWGQNPSELAQAAVHYIQENRSSSESLLITDIGCGYGRDAIYLSQTLKSQVLGVD
ncbi:class I SAM-dependent methyltransferase [Candidatus Bathyarchaeota archaeon]|nr:class I SAM-dependent methyltransferase [Candidatus Bathyarchaeota archaeon]